MRDEDKDLGKLKFFVFSLCLYFRYARDSCTKFPAHSRLEFDVHRKHGMTGRRWLYFAPIFASAPSRIAVISVWLYILATLRCYDRYVVDTTHSNPKANLNSPKLTAGGIPLTIIGQI